MVGNQRRRWGLWMVGSTWRSRQGFGSSVFCVCLGGRRWLDVEVRDMICKGSAVCGERIRQVVMVPGRGRRKEGFRVRPGCGG